MSWCPNCKTEYRKGIFICSDCGSDLVEELLQEEETVLLAEYEPEKKETAERLVGFLQQERISGVSISTKEDGSLSILIPESQKKRADKILAVFVKIELESEFSVLSEEEKRKKILEGKEKTEKQLSTHIYTKAEDRYKDNLSTAWTFLVIGILGLIFLALNVSGHLAIMAGTLQYIVSLIMFTAFIVLGIFSFTRNKSLEEAIKTEENSKKLYMDWLRSLPESEFSSVIQSEVSNEENEILLINYISDRLTNEFQEMNSNFADVLADEFFTEISPRILEE